MESKVCNVCLKEKPLSSFNMHKFTKDKKSCMCKKCKADKDKIYKQFKKVER